MTSQCRILETFSMRRFPCHAMGGVSIRLTGPDSASFIRVLRAQRRVLRGFPGSQIGDSELQQDDGKLADVDVAPAGLYGELPIGGVAEMVEHQPGHVYGSSDAGFTHCNGFVAGTQVEIPTPWRMNRSSAGFDDDTC